MALETPLILPNFEGRRFGSLALGYDRLETIRSEVSVLATAISTLLGIPEDQLTVRVVQERVAALQGLAAAFPRDIVDDTIGHFGADTDDDLLGLALACRAQLTSHAKR